MLLNAYDRVVCLCVDHRYEREWPRVRDLVGGKGGRATRFVDGRGQVLAPELYDRLTPTAPPPPGWSGSPGAVYQFLAMQDVVRAALDAGVESLLFLEDDVTFTDDFDAVVAEGCRQIRERSIAWDILYYGANHTWAKTEEVSPNVLRVFGSLTTHCLGIRRPAFVPILDLKPTLPIDCLIASELHPALGCYSLWPNVALQKPGYSYLASCYVDYTIWFGNRQAEP